MTPDAFKVCSICRTPIAFGSKYYACSVSTCRSKRMGLFFCSLPCFEAHVPEARHRDAWAEEERAPSREQAAAEARAEAASAPTAQKAPQGARPTEVRPAATAGARPNEVRPAAHVEDGTRRRIVGQSATSGADGERGQAEEDDKEVLVVVSKLKKYVRDRSGMNTSDSAIPVLSDHLRWLSVEALRKAAEDGRKTVMDRDYEAVIRGLRRLG
jgi:hypothetical protein